MILVKRAHIEKVGKTYLFVCPTFPWGKLIELLIEFNTFHSEKFLFLIFHKKHIRRNIWVLLDDLKSFFFTFEVDITEIEVSSWGLWELIILFIL